MKRVIMYLVLIIFLFLIGRQGYWLIEEGGNLTIYVTNESNIDKVTIIVGIDGEEIFSEEYENKKIYDYKHFSMFETLGTHDLKVTVKDKGIIHSEKFKVLGVTWINIEFGEGDLASSAQKVHISVDYSPIEFE